jgi:putative drug exporter of the RND superfamily
MVLVPATMALLGKANWWLPAWLDRVLPRVNVDGSASEPVLVADEHDGSYDVAAGVPQAGELVGS